MVCSILADIEFILFEYSVGLGIYLDELFYKSLTFLSFLWVSTGLSVVIGVFFLTSTTFPSLSIRIFIFLCYSACNSSCDMFNLSSSVS